VKIGILSDTHDNIPLIKKAVAYFNSKDCGFVFHSGDFVAPFTIPHLKKLSCEWKGVFGNNDGERNGLALASDSRITQGPLRLELERRAIVVVHDVHSLDLKNERADLVIFGHSHKPEVSTQGKMLLVNPGECGGWLSGNSTVAIADLSRLSAKIISL